MGFSLRFYEFMCAFRRYMKSPPSHILEICVPVCMFVCVCVARLYKGTDCVMLIKKTGYCPSHPVAFHQMLLFSSFMLVERGGGLSCLDIHCSACEGLCVFHPASFLFFFFFLSVCGSSSGMLRKVFLCALVFLRASAFSWGLKPTMRVVVSQSHLIKL